MTIILGTRAVLRLVEAGQSTWCDGCGEAIKFRAAMKHKRVLCNVYRGAQWDRLETWHEVCYREAGEPYGPVDASEVTR